MRADEFGGERKTQANGSTTQDQEAASGLYTQPLQKAQRFLKGNQRTGKVGVKVRRNDLLGAGEGRQAWCLAARGVGDDRRGIRHNAKLGKTAKHGVESAQLFAGTYSSGAQDQVAWL